jgi:hypothetical protein
MPEESYIRGAPAATIDPKKVGRVLAYVVALVLAGTGVALTVIDSSNHATASRLKHHGVPVQATVTSCVGISSGVGMGIEFYDCSGRYTLNGRTFVEPIRGNRQNLAPGSEASALAVPGDPASLALPGSVRSPGIGLSVAGYLLDALAVLILGVLLVFRRRRPGTPRRSESVPAPT